MYSEVLIYTGAALPFIWGLAHLFPTRSVVQGFGDISADNKHIITMEWIIEGAALMFTGIVVAVVTAIDPVHAVSKTVYCISAVFLVILAVISLFTGFRINFVAFRLCPVIFTSSAVLITLGWATLH